MAVISLDQLEKQSSNNNIISLDDLEKQQQLVQPDNLYNFSNADREINSRTPYYQGLTDVMGITKQPEYVKESQAAGQAPILRHPFQTALDLATVVPRKVIGVPLHAIGAGFNLVTGLGSDVALDLQRGRPQDIPSHLGQTIIGKRQPNVADVYKGAGVSPGISNAAGLATEVAFTSGGAKFITEIPGNIGKKFQGIEKFIGNIVNRAKASYITDEVAPQAHQIFQNNVRNLTPKIQEYATKELGVPQEAIDTIKKTGFNNIESIRKANNNTADNIVQKIQEGIKSKNTAVEQAYSDAFANNPKQINARQTFSQMHRLLRKANYIKSNGSLQTIAKAEGNNTALGKISQLYENMRPKNVILDRIRSGNMPLNKQEFIDKIRDSGKYRPEEIQNIADKLNVTQSDVILNSKITRGDIAKVLSKEQMNRLGNLNQLPMNSLQWNLLRNNLTKLRKSEPAISGRVTKILDALHNDAENSGLTGISKARALARTNFQAEDNILSNALLKENKLNNYYNLSGAEKRQLHQVQKYLGINFINDLKSVNAGKYIDKIKEGKSLDDFVNMLDQAHSRVKTNYVLNKLKPLVGEDNANKIIKEVIINRRLRIGRNLAVGSSALETANIIRNTLKR